MVMSEIACFRQLADPTRWWCVKIQGCKTQQSSPKEAKGQLVRGFS